MYLSNYANVNLYEPTQIIITVPLYYDDINYYADNIIISQSDVTAAHVHQTASNSQPNNLLK